MSIYAQTVPQHIKMLQNLDRWLEAAVTYAGTRKFDADTLLLARLAPDQYPLGRQVQVVCDNAKFCAARLTGSTAPSHPDTETTIPALRARIAAVVDYLRTFNEAAFAGASERRIELSFAPGMEISGEDYLHDMATPNLYFHLTLAYAILRHNGVPLGKRDFLGSIALAPKA
jgi:hypothetical protein